MKKVLMFILCTFVLTAFAEEDELYIVATGTCSVKESSAIKNSPMVYHRYCCYPLKVAKEGYDKRFAVAAYRYQMQRKFKEVRFDEVDVVEFSSKKEAGEYYKMLTKSRRYERLTLPRTSIERFRLKHAEESGEEVVGREATMKKKVTKKPSANKRAYHDIYD